MYKFNDIEIDGNKSSCRPLYNRRDGDCVPDKAYVQFNRDGKVFCSYTDSTYGTPVNAFNNLDLRFYIRAGMCEQDIRDLIEEIKPKVIQLLEASECDHERRWWSEDRNELVYDIEHICESFDESHYDNYCDDCAYCNEEW